MAIEIVEQASRPAAVVRGRVPLGEISAFFGRAFVDAAAEVARQGRTIVGPPFGYYPSMPTDTVEVVAGFPVDRAVEGAEGVEPFELPATRAVAAVHVGPYETLQDTYGAVFAWVQEHRLAPAGAMWEEYLSDPVAEPDPASWRTRVVVPIAAG